MTSVLRVETYGIMAASVDRPGDRPALSFILVVKMALDVQALLINMAFFTFLNSVEPGQHDLVLHTRRDLVFYLQHSNSALAPSHVLAMSCPEEEIHFLNLKRLSCFMKYTRKNIFPNILQLKNPQTNSL